jgi:hypothetical protein
MAIYQNTVCLVGWVAEVHSIPQFNQYAFRLMHGGFHESFQSAKKDKEAVVLIDIRVSRPDLASACLRHLKEGQRVTVHGRLVSENVSRGGRLLPESLWIDAVEIERTEALESFRFVNHPWKYELTLSQDRAEVNS